MVNPWMLDEKPRKDDYLTRKKNTRERTDWKALMGEDKHLLKAIVQQALQEVLEAEMMETVGADKWSSPELVDT